MLVTAILCSFIFGVVFTLLVQFLFLRNQLNNTPVEPIKNRPQFTDFKLPKVSDFFIWKFYFVCCIFFPSSLIKLHQLIWLDKDLKNHYFFIKENIYELPNLFQFQNNNFFPFFSFKELFEALKEALKKDQKESCLALNLIICFLFRELKDKQFIRRQFVMYHMLEFLIWLVSLYINLLQDA